MTNPQLIDTVLAAHTVFVRIVVPWGLGPEIEIQLPDLRSAPRSTAGADWGPSYRVAISPDCKPRCFVRTGQSTDEHRIDVAHLDVESPMWASDRRVTPLYIDLPLFEHALCVRVYYDAQGQAHRAELVHRHEPNAAAARFGAEIQRSETSLDSPPQRAWSEQSQHAAE